MAMLVLPEVFERTWGIKSEPFWAKAIERVHKSYLEFCFMAEVYWDLEWTMQQQGFDYTYDKRLYDRLHDSLAKPVREHLCADMNYQNRMARFLENHDELRAAEIFPQEIHQAAAVITYLSPGLRFFHQGQLEGKTKHISPHLVRGPKEPINKVLKDFYDRLINILSREIVRNGNWKLLECFSAWEGNYTFDSFIISNGNNSSGEHLLVCVNYSDHQSQCYVRLDKINGGQWRLKDLMSEVIYNRARDEMQSKGLYLDMKPWQYHVFEMNKISSIN
jgi:hypothetical protein